MKNDTDNAEIESTEFRFFGTLDIKQYDEHIKNISINSTKLELVLSIDEISNMKLDIDRSKNYLNQLENHLTIVKNDILKNFKEQGKTHQYVVHFLNGMIDKDYEVLKIEKSISDHDKLEAIFNQLECYRTQINFGYEKSFFSYDFMVGTGLTDYIITVVYNSSLKLNYIAIES